MASIKALNRSAQRGTIKTSVPSAILREDYGMEGDAHAGHWHRQLSLLAQESIDRMQELVDFPLVPGVFAENITTSGLALHTLPVGTRLTVGRCLVELTQIGKECHRECEIFRRVGRCVMPQEGVFARVLVGGEIHPGDPIAVVPSEKEEV